MTLQQNKLSQMLRCTNKITKLQFCYRPTYLDVTKEHLTPDIDNNSILHYGKSGSVQIYHKDVELFTIKTDKDVQLLAIKTWL